MRKLLLDRRNAARILAVNHIGNLFRQPKNTLFDNLAVADNVDRNTVVNVTEDIEVDALEHIPLHVDDVLSSHFLGVRILDNRNLGIQLVETELIVNIEALARLDVIQDNALRKAADI